MYPKFAAAIGLRLEDEEEAYDTLAGFLLARLGRIPKAADFGEDRGFRFEIVDMDGHRIDKVLVTKLRHENGPPQ